MGNILEIKDVWKKYGGNEVLKGINLSLSKGKIIGLVGPNGSGKSTLIKAINGLIKLDQGEILVGGEPIGIQSKSKISYLPDRSCLNERMRLKDILDFLQDFYPDFDKNRAKSLLDRHHLGEQTQISWLSKGNRQKVELILAMSRKTKLYVLDEPIGAVDLVAKESMINTIIKNYSEGSTIIIATHLIREIEHICDEMVFLVNGEVILHGNVETLREEKGKSMEQLFREVVKC